VGRNPLTKTFDHQTEETSIYQAWETSGAFKPSGKGEPYFLPMPPPNITGILHMGHALFATLQDISTRFNRMRGRNTLWLPGTDHAGLATQAKLDELMIAQGLDPQGPEFDAFAADYKANLKSTITGQLRRCGASADWSRETFTLDDDYSAAVIAAMEKCHEAGMLYQRDGQWWLDMEPLAAELLSEMDAGSLEIIPSGGEGTLRNFLTKIEPWCISRQIRWGHRLPIWKRNGIRSGIQRINEFTISATCPGDPQDWTQEEGCLDTWFSSALWPFATLGWPKDTPDMRTFYPAAMIETADDILFFWCARMLMMGLLLTDQMAFKTIFLHGLIRDKDGRKMAKSIGNGIDPLDIIEKFGCDAMRFALAEDATPGQDMRMWDEKFQAAKGLRTKIWNASRYAISHWDRIGHGRLAFPSQHPDDIAIRARLDETIQEMTAMLEGLRYHEAAFTIRQFIFNDLCGTYIEQTKSRLYDENDMAANATLMETLHQTLRLLHPFMPYVTERIRAAYSPDPLITTDWV
jgi:valyl-tRNA synthetase